MSDLAPTTKPQQTDFAEALPPTSISGRAQLGEPFPSRATAFAQDIAPAREVLAESRSLKGGGAAGIATVSAASIDVAHEDLAETQSAVLPLVPYLHTLRWVFIAVALIGNVAAKCRMDDLKRG